jgi:hypothetical protein
MFDSRSWRVAHDESKDWYNWLPKSEYRLCEPPAPEWVDVTEECALSEYGINGMQFVSIMHATKARAYLNVLTTDNGYRVRKIEVPYGVTTRHTLIIERRQP